jgi:hypothetical protein
MVLKCAHGNLPQPLRRHGIECVSRNPNLRPRHVRFGLATLLEVAAANPLEFRLAFKVKAGLFFFVPWLCEVAVRTVNAG